MILLNSHIESFRCCLSFKQIKTEMIIHHRIWCTESLWKMKLNDDFLSMQNVWNFFITHIFCRLFENPWNLCSSRCYCCLTWSNTHTEPTRPNSQHVLFHLWDSELLYHGGYFRGQRKWETGEWQGLEMDTDSMHEFCFLRHLFHPCAAPFLVQSLPTFSVHEKHPWLDTDPNSADWRCSLHVCV